MEDRKGAYDAEKEAWNEALNKKGVIKKSKPLRGATDKKLDQELKKNSNKIKREQGII